MILKNVNVRRNKQGGFILTSEAVLLATILVIGLTAGLTTVRDAMTAEMEDVAEAIGSLDQSYAFQGIQNAEQTAAVDGSSFGDAVDTNAGDESVFQYVVLDNAEGNLSIQSASGGASSASSLGSLTP